MADIETRRGDTFSFTTTITDSLGNPIVGKAANLKSQLKTEFGELVAEMEISEMVTPGDYEFVVYDTSDWPLGEIYFNIKYTDGQVKSSSDPTSVNVTKEGTT